MNATAADQLVASYLARLQAALRDLPAARRDELLEQVSEHIATARAELGAQASEAEIRMLLDRLGDPAAIAAEAGHGSDELVEPPRARPGWLEVAALVLLPIGGIVVPVLGWFVGVALLWTSERWSVRDKLLGTLVVPGGLALPLALGLFTTTTETCVTAPVPASGAAQTPVCTGGPPGWLQVLGPVALVLLLLAPIGTVIYLGVRLRRQPSAAA
jgi:HAAS